MSINSNILIAGAGPVGLAAAIELTRYGFKPKIIDNDEGPTPESRALAIHARTLDIMEPSGVTDRLIAAGNRINGIIFRDGLDVFMGLNFKELPHRFNFILALPQTETEKIMIEALQQQGGEVGWMTTLQSVVLERDGFACALSTGNGENALSADILIGADGAHSTVRKALELGFVGETMAEEFGLADVVLDDWPFPPDRAVVTIDGDRIAAFFPYGEGSGRFVTNHPDTLNRLPPDAKIGRVKWQSSFRISYRQVKSYQKGNGFLAGDAAHIHSPVGGRGMNLGIEDAATLAWLIKEQRTPDYTSMRHPVGEAVLRLTKQQTSQLSSLNPVKRFITKQIGPLLLKIPAIRRMAITRITGLDTPFPPWLKP